MVARRRRWVQPLIQPLIVALALIELGCASTRRTRPRHLTGSAFDIERFSRRESSLYRPLAPLLRDCTVAHNARAGATWVRTLVAAGPDAKLDIAQVGRALDNAGKRRLAAGELADLGWLVAEILRKRAGGRYRFADASGQVTLVLTGGLTLEPMRLIGEIASGKRSLEAATRAVSAASGAIAEPSCHNVRPIDVVGERMRWRGQRKRRTRPAQTGR